MRALPHGFALVDQIATENPQYLVGKVNMDSEPELAQAFGVASIPMLVVMKVESRSAGRSARGRRFSPCWRGAV